MTKFVPNSVMNAGDALRAGIGRTEPLTRINPKDNQK
jgi:hypothetical protein